MERSSKVLIWDFGRLLMSSHNTPLHDAASFGDRRDGQRTLARTILSGVLVVICVAAIPAIISLEGAVLDSTVLC